MGWVIVVMTTFPYVPHCVATILSFHAVQELPKWLGSVVEDVKSPYGR